MKRRTDEEISAPLYQYDAAIRAEYGCFAGVDEAGRGPLAAPFVWLPASWTRKIRSTASMTLKN